MPPSAGELNRQVARQVLTQTLNVKPGENVTIEAWSESLPWAVPFVTEARRLGAQPIMLYEDEEAFWEALRTGASASTGRVGRHEWNALKDTDAYVFFFGPAEWPRFDSLSDKKTEGVAAYNPEWYKRAAKAGLRGARMYIGRTSRSAAERWQVDLRAWRAGLQAGTLASPNEMHRLGVKLGRRLTRGRTVRVTHANGTDLQFRLNHYPVQIDDAIVDSRDLKSRNNMANIPGGVVGVAIDHTSARGLAVGNHRTYPDTGPAEGIRWKFRQGRLTEHAYAKGGPAFDKALRSAPPKGRDRLSFFSIGLNGQLANCPQMEDQEIGNVLLRIGGNRFFGGRNDSPFGSWMVIGGADVSVDNRPVVRGGQIV